MNQVVFIVGPTATGKTDVAYLLAQDLGAQIISCDSMLIYKEPSLIISKPSYTMMSQVKHHFVGIISVEESYNVFSYFRTATETIRKLFFKNIPVIVCGGSGLYVKALLDGIFEGASRDDNLRKSLQETARLYGQQYLYEELKKVDLPAAKRISPYDLRRIIRALEVYYITRTPISEKQTYSFGLYGDLPIRIFGLRLQRGELYRRINARVDAMFAQGVVDEIKGMRQFKLSLTAEKIIGVREIGEFLEGKINEAEARLRMKKNTRRFAKRQITWFKKDNRIEWIDIDSLTPEQIKEKILQRINV